MFVCMHMPKNCTQKGYWERVIMHRCFYAKAGNSETKKRGLQCQLPHRQYASEQQFSGDKKRNSCCLHDLLRNICQPIAGKQMLEQMNPWPEATGLFLSSDSCHPQTSLETYCPFAEHQNTGDSSATEEHLHQNFTSVTQSSFIHPAFSVSLFHCLLFQLSVRCPLFCR